jgi:hypothetical protein
MRYRGVALEAASRLRFAVRAYRRTLCECFLVAMGAASRGDEINSDTGHIARSMDSNTRCNTERSFVFPCPLVFSETIELSAVKC